MSSDPTPGELTRDDVAGEPDPDEAARKPAPDEAGGEPAPDEPAGEPGAAPTPCAYTDYVEGEAVEDLPATGEGATGLAADVWAVLRDVDDPEMPVSVVDLGLIYGVDVEPSDEVDVEPGDVDATRPAGDVSGEDDVADEDDVAADAGAHVRVAMTLTYTGCPARKYLTEEIEERVAAVDGVGSVDLQLVWDPPWSLELVTAGGREQLREFGLSL